MRGNSIFRALSRIGLIGISAILGLFICGQLLIVGQAEIENTHGRIESQGVIDLENQPTDDKATVQASMDTLIQQKGWSTDETALNTLTRLVACNKADSALDDYSLSFIERQPISFFTSQRYTALITINNKTNFNYLIRDDGWENITKAPSFAIDQLNISSATAITTIENIAKKNPPNQTISNCAIRAWIAMGQAAWHVDMVEIGSFRPLLCYDIDIQNGAAAQVQERDGRACG